MTASLSSCSHSKKLFDEDNSSGNIKLLKINKSLEQVYEASVAYLSDKIVIENDRENGRIITTFTRIPKTKQFRQIKLHIFQNYMDKTSVTVLIAIRDIKPTSSKSTYDPILEWNEDKDLGYFTENNKYTPEGFVNTVVQTRVYKDIKNYLDNYRG